MIYFQTVLFPDDVEQIRVEKLLRSSAIKRTSILDFKSAILDIGRDKDFLGFESLNSLSFTRTKTSFAFLLPKIIINLEKNPTANFYRLRLAVTPFCLLLVIAFGLLTSLITSINGNINLEAFVFFLVLFLFFSILLLLEISVTKATVNKCISSKINANSY